MHESEKEAAALPEYERYAARGRAKATACSAGARRKLFEHCELNMLRRIVEMLREAEKANWDSRVRWESGEWSRHKFMVDESYKELREQWSLGYFVELYNYQADTKLVFGEHLPEGGRPQPDFAVYDGSGALRVHVEVTEWLEARKRDREYSQPFKETAEMVGGFPGSDLPCPTDGLRVQLASKVRTKARYYPPNTWLLIDDNVGLGAYYEHPLGDVEVARSIVQELKNELTTISRIWLLRQTTRPMTVHQLFPKE